MEFNREIRSSCKKLLERISRKSVSEERMNEVISHMKDNLDYITEVDVKLSIEGLNHKFIMHAEYEKSRIFLKLVNRIIDLTKPVGLSHPTWQILHLLFRLAFRPTRRSDFILENNTFQSIDAANQVATEGICAQEKQLLFKQWSEINNDVGWSTDEEFKDGLNALKNEKEVGPAAKFQIYHCLTDKVPLFKETFNEAFVGSIFGTMVQSKFWDAAAEKGQLNCSEFQLLHDILWVMHSRRGVSSHFVESSSGQINRIGKSANLSSLASSSSCLEEYLSEISPIACGLQQLNAFVDDVFSALQPTYVTLTHQAYAAALNCVIRECYKSLSEFEDRVAEQNTTTTLAHLKAFVKPWVLVISSLTEIQSQVSSHPGSTANHILTAQLLSILSLQTQVAQVKSYSCVYPVLLRLLYSSLTPTLDMIDRWFFRGQIVDPFHEFCIERNSSISPQDEHFWHEALLVRPSHLSVDFLKPLIEEILQAGRSIELLSQLGSLPYGKQIVGLSSNDCQLPLKDIFKQSFNGFVSDKNPVLSPTISSPPSMARSLTVQGDNPLLKNTFDFFSKKEAQRTAFRRSSSPLSSNIEIPLQTPSEFYPPLPLLQCSLLKLIRSKKRLVCETLIDVLYNQCSLRKHLLFLRSIHLMQAGDVMDRFCLKFIQKENAEDKWESESALTLFLLNCISTRMKGAAPYVSISFKDDRRNMASKLNQLNIKYAVQWPINMIITQESLESYNSIFRFLLQMKGALMSLQRLTFKGMHAMDSSTPLEFLPAPARQHRLQLLRAWILHFISSLDYYIMECVLESSHAIFDTNLLKATHLGEIAESHQQYIQSIHKQCLQQASTNFLLDAINEIFSIGASVASAWTEGIQGEQLVQLENAYVRQYQYVASLLKTDAAHSMLPHVETLVTALTHSCPITEQN